MAPPGLPQDKATLDYALGKACLDLASALDQCANLNTMLYNANRGFAIVNSPPGTYTSSAMVALGYSTGDVQLIGAAFGALGLLQTIAYGTVAGVATTNDYFLQAQQLMGTEPL